MIRTPWAGAAELLAALDATAAIVNAGDGKHEHPTQALLDVYTLRRRLGALDGRDIWIVGDVLHSRVARSNILAFRKMGAQVTVAGPPTLIPRGIEALGCEVRYDARRPARGRRRLRAADAARADGARPTCRRCASTPRVYQIDGRRLLAAPAADAPRPRQPRRRAVSGEVVDSPQALITAQVEAGVVVRMAVLYELLAGARARARRRGAATDHPEPQLA